MGRKNHSIEDIEAYAETAYELTVKYHDVVQSKVISVVESLINRTDHEESLVAVFYRLHLLMRSLGKLNQSEDFQTVRSTARSLYELLLDLRHLASDSSLAEKYWRFVDVERMRSAIQVADFVGNNSTPERKRIHRAAISLAMNLQKLAEIEVTLKQVWGITTDIKVDRAKKFPKSWSQKSVRSSAESLGGDFAEAYFTEYAVSSWFTHGGFVGISGMSNSQIVNLFGRGHLLAQENYLKATKILATSLRLFDAVPDLSESLRELEGSQHASLLLKLIRKNTPGDDCT